MFFFIVVLCVCFVFIVKMSDKKLVCPWRPVTSVGGRMLAGFGGGMMISSGLVLFGFGMAKLIPNPPPKLKAVLESNNTRDISALMSFTGLLCVPNCLKMGTLNTFYAVKHLNYGMAAFGIIAPILCCHCNCTQRISIH